MAAVWLTPGVPAGTAVPAPQGQPAVIPAPKGFKTFTDPARRLSLAYPDKWKPVAGARDVVLTITSTDFKTVVVVQQQIADPPPEISARLMGLEVEGIKYRQPDAIKIAPSVAKFRPSTMIVDYSRPGINGPERVRQYGIYEATLIRVTCIAPEKDFEKHEKSFETIATSLKISTRPAGGASIDR